MRYLHELPAWLEAELGEQGVLYLLHGRNSDSGNWALPAAFAGDGAFAARRDTEALFGALAEAGGRSNPKPNPLIPNWVYLPTAHVGARDQVQGGGGGAPPAVTLLLLHPPVACVP